MYLEILSVNRQLQNHKIELLKNKKILQITEKILKEANEDKKQGKEE